MIDLKQEDGGRVSIHRNGVHIGSARSLADKQNPLVCLKESVVLKLTELEEITERLRAAANQS